MMTTQRNHLVVGMNGTIGSALFGRLQLLGANVVGTTQRQSTASQPHIQYLSLQDASTWQSDRRVDVVYLCAGICRMALCEEDPEATYKVNVDATLALAQYYSMQGSFIVYLSTNQVFSGDQPFMRADAEYGAQNEYGRQKASIEHLLQQHCPQLAIARLTKVVEPGFALIQNWITSLTQNQPVRAFYDMMLAPVSLRQVVDIMIKIGEQPQAGIYQISGAEDVSYFELASYMAAQLSRPSELIQSANAQEGGMRKSFLPRFTTLDCSSIISSFDESPPHYSEVLKECFDTF
jgi:dTDP-4-dehydrorhamnose reductase